MCEYLAEKKRGNGDSYALTYFEPAVVFCEFSHFLTDYPVFYQVRNLP